MRIVLSTTIAFACVCAAVAQAPDPAMLKRYLSWRHQCDDVAARCWFEKLVDFKRSNGTERGGVGISYDKQKATADFVAIIVPPDVNPKSEVTIRFLDSTMKEGSWKLIPVGGFLGLPISGCDAETCQARVHSQIPDGPDLFQEFRRRNHVWVSFVRNGESDRFLVPLSGLDTEIESIN